MIALVAGLLGVTVVLSACARTPSPDPVSLRMETDAKLAEIINDENVKVTALSERESGLFEMYLEGVTHPSLKDEKTKIFSLLGIPPHAKGEKLPAIVLIHGGGGTAFEDWVRLWNDEGFVALAVTTEGQTDNELVVGKRPREWARHDFSGPARAGIYQDMSKPLSKQWMFHAVTAAVIGHNYLRSHPEVDSDEIGVEGISWGGIITSTVVGFDDRFAFAIPIYGAGDLANIPNQYQSALAGKPGYEENWEPMLRLENFKSPVLWVNGREDSHFSLNSLSNSALSTSGPNSFAIVPGLKHGHKPAWDRREPYIFANAVVNEEPPISYEIKKYHPGQTGKAEDVTIVFRSIPKEMQRGDLKATLHTTETPDDKLTKDWNEHPVVVETASGASVRVTVPLENITSARNWFVTLTNTNNKADIINSSLTFSTRYCRENKSSEILCG